MATMSDASADRRSGRPTGFDDIISMMIAQPDISGYDDDFAF